MTQRTLALLVATLAAFGVSRLAGADTAEYDAETAAVVRIYAVREEGGKSIGAGTFISRKGQILTAYHVVQGATEIEVFGRAGQYRRPTLVKFDETRDLAVLEVERPSTDTATLAIGSVPPGIEVRPCHAYGHPDGKLNFRIGVDVNRNGAMRSQEYLGPEGARIFASSDIQILPIDGTINRGMSGGPLVCDGKLIGVISGTTAPSGRNLGWAMLASDVERLKEARGKSFRDLPKLAMLARGFTSPTLKTGEISERWRKLDEYSRLFTAACAEHQAFLDSGDELTREVARLRQLAANGPLAEAIGAISTVNQASAKRHRVAMDLMRRIQDDIVYPVNHESSKEIDSMTEEQTMVMAFWKAAPMLEESDRQETLKRQKAEHGKTVDALREKTVTLKARLGEALKKDDRNGALKEIMDDYADSIEQLEARDRELLSTIVALGKVELLLYDKYVMLKSSHGADR